MAESDRFSVRFWGVRGSFPRPGPDTLRYGGNTSCIEMRCGPHLLIFDGGTGLYPLGRALEAESPVEADVLFTHTHFDHICGLPFFGPAFAKGNRFRLWSGHLAPQDTLERVICSLMQAPIYPVPFDIMAADITFEHFAAGDALEPRPGVVIRTAALNHPNEATGYRVEFAGKSVCYVTDTEHRPGAPDENVLGLIAGADLVIYDCTYTDEEFPAFVDWGHSTWEEGVRLCDAAGAKTLVVFHHAPEHDDAFMDGVAAAAERARPGTVVAREDMELSP